VKSSYQSSLTIKAQILLGWVERCRMRC